MRLVLYASAAIAVVYASIRAVQDGPDAELGAGLAVVTAAVCAGSGAVVGAIDRNRPKSISKDNGGAS